METNQRKVITLNGFFKWFFCGCEVERIYVYGDCPKDSEIKRYSDLTRIEGIGPVIKDLLNKKGIHSFDDLASANVDDLRKFLDDASLQYHEPDTWPEQAKLASLGKWEELEIWQDELDGGKEK